MNLSKIIAIITLASLSSLVSVNTYAKPSNPAVIRPGKHMLSLQWLLFSNNYGTATISKPNSEGWQTITGKHEGIIQDQPAFLEINGSLKKISNSALQFEGTIRTKIPYHYKGNVCERTGSFTFTQSGKRKYWRMKPLDNCEGSADYIDIYF